LGSLFRNSIRYNYRFTLPVFTPKRYFANASSEPKPETPVEETQATPASEKTSDSFDPRIEELTKKIYNAKVDALRRVYRNCDYEKDMLPALNFLDKLQFNDIQLKYLFLRKPTILRVGAEHQVNDVINLTAYLQKRYGLQDKHVRTTILRNPWIFNLTNEQIQERCDYLHKRLGMTDKEVRRLLIIYPTTFNLHPDEIEEKVQLLDDLLKLPARTVGIIAARFPFFLRNKTNYLSGNIMLLRNRGFSIEQIITIMKRHAEAFTMNPPNLEQTFVLPTKAGMTREEIAKVFTEQPRLLTIDPTAVQPKKITIFRRNGITFPEIYQMIREHPRILVKSVGSINLKIRYLRQRMKIDVKNEPTFPALLNYSYASIIRPRGEILLKQENPLPWAQVLNLTDEEFVAKTGSTLEELNRLKSEFKDENNELDYKLKFFSRYFHNSGVNAKY